MKPTINILIIVSAFFFLAGCKSNETRVLDDIDRLTTRIEKEGSEYDFEDWAEALDELKLIQEDASYCDFTPRQAEEYGRKIGRLQVVILKNGIGTVKEAIEGYYSPFLKGLLQGWGDEIRKIPEDTGLIQDGTELMEDLEELSKEGETLINNLTIPSDELKTEN